MLGREGAGAADVTTITSSHNGAFTHPALDDAEIRRATLDRYPSFGFA